MLLQIIILLNTKTPHNFFHVIFTEQEKMIFIGFLFLSELTSRRWFLMNNNKCSIACVKYFNRLGRVKTAEAEVERRN